MIKGTALGLRTNVDYSGVAFAAAMSQPFGYDDRNELTSSSRSGTAWTYTYDPIGNRTTFEQSGQPQATYAANGLDQYTLVNQPTLAATLVQSLEYDPDGSLQNTWAAGDMNCDGVVNFADVDAFNLALQGQTAYEAQYPNCNWLNADCNGDGTVNFNDIDAFTALLTSGNQALALTFVWDGENRLSEWRPTFPADTPGAQKVTCSYDYEGRRVEKKVYNWVSGQWQTTPALDRKFVWSGWLMLMELDGLSGNAVVRQYTWGLDLAGQAGASASGRSALEGAGTIGGLLAVHQAATGGFPGTPAADYVYAYDANGNVGQVVNLSAFNATSALRTKYEYDPYGNRTNTPETGEYDQPFRFSTKYWDAETGLYYFGYRYYHPGLGRWMSRDALGEEHARNLYGYVTNSPPNSSDYLGLCAGKIGLPGAQRPWGGEPIQSRQAAAAALLQQQPGAPGSGRTPVCCSRSKNTRGNPYTSWVCIEPTAGISADAQCRALGWDGVTVSSRCTEPAPTCGPRRPCELGYPSWWAVGFEADPGWCKDDEDSGLLHPGLQCYREITVSSTGCGNMRHVCFDRSTGDCVDAHTDSIGINKGKSADGGCDIDWCCWFSHIVDDVLLK